MRRFVVNTDDFLVAGREVNLYLGIASLAATEFGIVTCMYTAQLGFNHGFAGMTPGLAMGAAMLFVGLTGFCVKKLRDSGSITLPELFEAKFGTNVRTAGGIVIVVGGLLNMGVFLRMGGEFLVYSCGINPEWLEIIMTGILIIVALYTIMGGMLAILITDYIQFIFMSIGLLIVSGIVLYTIGWEALTDTVSTRHGESGFNPFVSNEEGTSYSIQRVIYDIMVGIAVVLTWQTIISRVLAAKDSATGLKIYIGTSYFFVVRFAIPVMWGIAAAAYLSPEVISNLIESDKTILAMPTLLSTLVPVGVLGLVIAAMLAADMSTNSAYMLAWSSVIFNDIIRPFRKSEWSARKEIGWNRTIIGLIGVFLLFWGLWYELEGDLWTYLQLTGTIYLASMSILTIAACYWDKANNWGAMAAIITGASIPIAYLACTRMEGTDIQALANDIGPYYSGIATFALVAVAMVGGSLIKPNTAGGSHA